MQDDVRLFFKVQHGLLGVFLPTSLIFSHEDIPLCVLITKSLLPFYVFEKCNYSPDAASSLLSYPVFYLQHLSSATWFTSVWILRFLKRMQFSFVGLSDGNAAFFHSKCSDGGYFPEWSELSPGKPDDIGNPDISDVWSVVKPHNWALSSCPNLILSSPLAQNQTVSRHKCSLTLTTLYILVVRLKQRRFSMPFLHRQPSPPLLTLTP